MSVTPAKAKYNPLYDPLRDPHPGVGRDYAPTYWLAAAGAPPDDDGPITSNRDTDVVIVGSGYTGLTCALFLAREYGIKATVLEANRVAWGCSTRNGGQGQNASGRLTRSQWISTYGQDMALRLHAEILEGFERFSALVRDIDCDEAAGGHLYIAHRQRTFDKLQAESEVCNKIFGYKTRIIDRETLKTDWVDEAEAKGALHEPLGIGVNPAKLAFGYQRAARAAGAKIHPASPVLGITRHNNRFHVTTPGGVVRAGAVVLATGGYTGQTLHKTVRSKIMPVLSNNMVTRPLSASEIAATSFKTHQVITDTRVLRYYYRLLPDNRLQIGSRSAITGMDADNPVHVRVLTDGLARKFPALAGIEIDYSWWGWVDVSHDMMPRIVQPNAAEPLFYAMGYGGNGVSYSAQAGWRLAGLVAGRTDSSRSCLPIFKDELPGHVFAPFRRLGQRMLYQLYQHRDEKPDAA